MFPFFTVFSTWDWFIRKLDNSFIVAAFITCHWLKYLLLRHRVVILKTTNFCFLLSCSVERWCPKQFCKGYVANLFVKTFANFVTFIIDLTDIEQVIVLGQIYVNKYLRYLQYWRKYTFLNSFLINKKVSERLLNFFINSF